MRIVSSSNSDRGLDRVIIGCILTSMVYAQIGAWHGPKLSLGRLGAQCSITTLSADSNSAERDSIRLSSIISG